ncbi:MAG: F0F1 ATP synthase subunit epsilon [Acholeplasmatales bacterium]|nr:F0F1 ATP synthase subunit epsilon [Acholeplasmatales bacterium]
MRIICSTHQGNVYNDEVDYVVVHNKEDGEFAVMNDHVPIISVMGSGFIKLVRGKDEFYVVITSGIFEFHDNIATVLCQEAQIGRSKDSAYKNLSDIRHERSEINKTEATESTKMEQDLYENIKNSGAGNL